MSSDERRARRRSCGRVAAAVEPRDGQRERPVATDRLEHAARQRERDVRAGRERLVPQHAARAPLEYEAQPRRTEPVERHAERQLGHAAPAAAAVTAQRAVGDRVRVGVRVHARDAHPRRRERRARVVGARRRGTQRQRRRVRAKRTT